MTPYTLSSTAPKDFVDADAEKLPPVPTKKGRCEVDLLVLFPFW